MELNTYIQKIASTYRPARTLLVAFLVFAAIAVAPRLTSQATPLAPTFTQTNLVSNAPGRARIMDPNLVNPWGMALGVNSGIWISDHGSGKATTYYGTGQPIPSNSPQSAAIPAPGTSSDKSSPTGVATNDTTGFVISAHGVSAPCIELIRHRRRHDRRLEPHRRS